MKKSLMHRFGSPDIKLLKVLGSTFLQNYIIILKIEIQFDVLSSTCFHTVTITKEKRCFLYE